MSTMKPNHICKWCGKSYYACDYCDMTNPKRSVSCSDECYTKYEHKVLEIRAKAKMERELNKTHTDVIMDALLPERTDMSKEAVKDMVLSGDKNTAKEKSISELTEAGYGKYLNENGLSKTIEKVNSDIETKTKTSTKRTRKPKVNS